MTPASVEGALLQVVFHAIAKNILFLCAGAIIYKTHKTYVYELRGIGKQMPIVMWCFTLASLSLVGIPPFAGFFSKWYLATAALSPEFGALGIVGAASIIAFSFTYSRILIPYCADSLLPGQRL